MRTDDDLPEPDATSDDSPPSRRETTGGVLGIGFGLLVAFVLLVVLAFPMGGPLDGEARLSELLGAGEPPFGLELVEAARLPTGDVVLRLGRPGEDDGGAGPEEVLFVQYRSQGSIAPLFEGEENPGETLQRWKDDPSWSWEAILERDEITWDVWRTKFARVRHFAEGGGWSESFRVDLSQPGRALVLMARWGEKENAEREELLELLKAVVMVE